MCYTILHDIAIESEYAITVKLYVCEIQTNSALRKTVS
jgi:hypothetical protein